MYKECGYAKGYASVSIKQTQKGGEEKIPMPL